MIEQLLIFLSVDRRIAFVCILSHVWFFFLFRRGGDWNSFTNSFQWTSERHLDSRSDSLRFRAREGAFSGVDLWADVSGVECVVECCSVLQYVAVGCKCVAILFCEWKGAFSGADFWADVSGVVLCCSVLQCGAVGCIGLSMLHYLCARKGAFSSADFCADVSGVVACCSVLQ